MLNLDKKEVVTALVMAGGKGSRLDYEHEKPLITINKKPMILYVIDALKSSEKIDNIVVATSKNTPKTTEFLKKMDISTIVTSGDDYIEDLGFLLSKFKENDILITITADLPRITSEILDYVIYKYENSKDPAMSVMIPAELFKEYGLKPTSIFNNLVPSGLNILRGINKTQNEEVLIISKIELALNINTCEDIKLLKEIMGD